MRKVILYVAISLDGKIAKSDGSVEWLEDLPNPENSDHDYVEFYESIDTTIMGNATYQQVKGFDVPFPYKEKTNYVLTRNTSLTEEEYVKFISEDPVGFVASLKAEKGKDIWLVGGAKMVELFLEHKLVDVLRIFVIPIILGAGIPLFGEKLDPEWLTLKESKSYSTGAVGITYEMKQ